MTEHIQVKRLTLELMDRDDGGLHISSPDVPGMHLSGADRVRVWTFVAPAITDLLLRNQGLKVSHVYLPAEEVAFTGPSPRTVPAHARCATVVVDLATA